MNVSRTPAPRDAPVVVVGELDGFHSGHRGLVRSAELVSARFRRALVGVVIDAADQDAELMEPDARCAAVVRAGVPSVHCISFDSSQDMADIVDHVIDRFAPALVVLSCVPDPASSPRLPRLASGFERRGIGVIEVERTTVGGAPVNALLGRPYSLVGPVVHGQQLGRTIGFPTANLEPPPRRLVPRSGVYAALAHVDGIVQLAAVNIGTRPTVDDSARLLIEAHLLDFAGDLYGLSLRLDLVARLRDERRFGGLDALTAQLGRDVADARSVLADHLAMAESD